jgi:hypothetical protein
MGVQNPNSTSYVHPDEPNILNLHKAMEYNALGQPIIRTVAGGGTGGIDAFGRMQVAEPYTLFDSQHRYAENEKFFTTLSGSASKTYDANASLVNMVVSGASGDKVVRETDRVFPYQPGKALEIFNTFTMASGATGLRQRVGYFNDNNGIFLEQANNQLFLVLRSYSSGSLVENRVAQANWNTDTLDGNGNSKITLDVTKSQIQFIDIEWLGVGTVRAGFVIDGAFVIAHKFHHANSITGTYMTTATLPIRYEIENTGATDVSSTLKHICNTIISSGGFSPTGRSVTVGRGLSYYSLPTAGTFYHLVSIKLSSGRLDDVIIPTDVNVMTDSNQNLQFKLVKNATFGTTLSYTAANSIEYSITNSAVTNQGSVLLSAYIVNKGEARGFNLSDLLKYQLTRTSTADVYSIIVTADTNNTNATGNISWMEPLRG